MNNKTILIAGASGLIGNSAARYFDRNRVIRLSRQDFLQDDQEFIDRYQEADIILNFAGSPVIKRWNARNKKEILSSRTETTKKLGLLVNRGGQKKRVFISASAIGIYPDIGEHSEASNSKGSGFMSHVVESWEKEVSLLSGPQCRTLMLRFGVVLSREGGIMKRMIPVYRIGLGGKLGSGNQPFSWIHIDDVMGVIGHVLEEGREGKYNVVAPGIRCNRDFSKVLAAAMNRNDIFRLPCLAVKILYGKGSEVVCGGQNAVPGRLMREGYGFKFRDLEEAIIDIVD